MNYERIQHPDGTYHWRADDGTEFPAIAGGDGIDDLIDQALDGGGDPDRPTYPWSHVRDPESGIIYAVNRETGQVRPVIQAPRSPGGDGNLSGSPDRIENPDTGTYWVFDQRTGQYKDTGVRFAPTGTAAPRPDIHIDQGTGEFVFIHPDGRIVRSGQHTSPIGALDQARLGIDRQRLAQDAATVAANISQITAQISQGQQSIDLQRDALRIQEQQGNDRLALDTRAQIEREQARLADNELSLRSLFLQGQQLQAQIRAGNADRSFAADNANADRGFQAASDALDRSLALISERATDERFRLDQQRQIASDLAAFAQQPGDVAAQAGFLQAIGPSAPGGLGTAIAQGQDFRTNESLATGAMQLGLLDQLRQPSPTLFGELADRVTQPASFERVSAQQVAEPNLSGLTAPLPGQATGGLAPRVSAAPQPTATPTAAPTATAQPAQTGGQTFTPRQANIIQGNTSAGGGTDVFSATGQAALTPVNAPDTFWTPEQVAGLPLNVRQQLFGFAGGGQLFNGMGIVGDSPTGERTGVEELVIDPTNDAMVVPLNPENALPPARRFAVGGLFNDDLFNQALGGTVTPELIARARQFATQAGLSAAQRIGFKRIPTPISVSAPGTSPFLQQAAAGVTSALRGLDPRLFNEDLQRTRAIGMNENLPRRIA